MEVEHYCLVDNTALTLYYSSNDKLEFDDLKGSNEKEKPILKRNTISSRFTEKVFKLS